MTATSNDLEALIVENSPMQQRVIADALKKRGVSRIRFAPDGSDAFEQMNAALPSFVVSSLYLPDMLATDLVQMMRGRVELVHVPFILVSSETKPQVIDAIRQAGACTFLPKPFSEAQLAAAMRSTISYLQAEESLALGAGIDLETLRVLIVDDSANSRRFLHHVLEQLGVEHFLEAADGREAARILGQDYVDLVITDYNMPDMNGKELIEHIRTQSWQSSVPILMVTGEIDADRLAEAKNAGVSAICEKPFDPPTIRVLIERALAG
ncbi:MAG: response regulator [Betaproteobacteria bacterium]|nr:response regulator [Betaproteobacteria bacterium]